MRRTISDAMEFLSRLSGNVVLQLARDKVPMNVAEELLELGVVYDYYGDQSKYRLTNQGREWVAETLNGRSLVGYAPQIITDDEKQARKVGELRAKKDKRVKELEELRAARTGAVHEEAKKLALLMVRGLEETECVSCGAEIEFKQLRIFDRKKRYECTICGQRVKPKKVARQPGAGRLPVIQIDGGFGAVVCYDCVQYCSSCWTGPTYKHIMKVYGVDLRDE